MLQKGSRSPSSFASEAETLKLRFWWSCCGKCYAHPWPRTLVYFTERRSLQCRTLLCRRSRPDREEKPTIVTELVALLCRGRKALESFQIDEKT